MDSNRLKLIADKTQVIWVGTRQQLDKIHITELQLQSANVLFAETVSDLGVVVAYNRIADWSIRGLINLLTGQLADWTNRGLHGQHADWTTRELVKVSIFSKATITLTTQVTRARFTLFATYR